MFYNTTNTNTRQCNNNNNSIIFLNDDRETVTNLCEGLSGSTDSCVTITVQRVAFILTENKIWTSCGSLNYTSVYLFSLMDSLLSDALSAHWSPVLRNHWPPACRLCKLTESGQQGRVEYSSRGGWDTSSWSAEVWSSPRGKPLVWVNTITIQQRDTLPGSGNFLVCQNNVWHCCDDWIL